MLARRLVEAKPGLGIRAGADLPGAALLTGGVMVGVYAVLGVAEHGWASQRTQNHTAPRTAHIKKADGTAGL